MFSLCPTVRPLLKCFKNKQNVYKKIVHRLLKQDARIIIPNFKGTDYPLSLIHREKIGIFSVITVLASLAYESTSAYLNWKKKQNTRKRI